MATTSTCLGCGSDLGPGNRFCSSCGTPADSTSGHGTGASQEPDLGSWADVVQRLRRATLGEFEIGRELGRGAMAAVFLAHEISLDRKVAIKVMSPGLLMDEGMAERFKREAITIAHLNHPNIVSVHSVRQAEGLHFFVMRYIRGRALEQVIQQAGKLPIPIVRSILFQVGSALTYAHRSRVVHRDIKPANILIDEDGSAVVTDFGIAKVAELPSATHPGALVGTPAYMSPEQCSGAEVSGASDQYALGAVAYEMITGISPFTGSSLTVMQAHLEQPPQPILNRSSECPPELEAAVLRMLAKDPAARWPSIAEAKAALGAAPLAEDDPLLAELCRLATPDWTTSLPGRATLATPRTKPAPSPAPAGLVRTISILPPPAALETGDSFMLVALLRGDRGVLLPGRAVQWATDTPEVLRVDGLGGVATAVAPGAARLTATCEGVRARLQVQVAPPLADDADSEPEGRVTAIQMSAPPKSVKAGDSFALTATPLDYRGGFLLGHTVQWSTSDVGVAIVTASGWVATLGRGPVVLTATCEGVSAAVGITVEEAVLAPKRVRPRPPSSKPREFEPAAAEPRPVRRRRGSRSRKRELLAASVGVLLLASLLWLSGGLRRVLPQASRSRLTAPAADDSVFQSTTAEPVAAILRGAPASVSIRRGPRRPLLPGTTTKFAAEVKDLAGQAVPGSGVRWSSTDSSVARVDSASGRVRALRPGRTVLVASIGEARDSVPVVVRRPPAEPPQAASLSITPPGSLRVGDSVTPAADVPDGSGVAELSAETLAAQSYESEPPVKAIPKDLDGERQRLNATVSAGVQECYDALRSKNVGRVAELYRPAQKSDGQNLNKLTRILRTEEWAAVVGNKVDGPRQLGARTAAMEFSVELAWKDAFGGRLTRRPVFRAEFAKNGNDWEISSCRMVGSPKL